MKRFSLASAAFVAMSVFGAAQQVNTLFASMAINYSPLNALGLGPTTTAVFTDSLVNINVQGFPGTPVLILYGNLQPNATITPWNFRVDLANEGNLYANQVLVDGYSNPGPATWTQGGTGTFTYTGSIPACSYNASGVLSCLAQASFSKSVQAIVWDTSNAPFFVRSTAACTLAFTNGYTNFSLSTLSGDASTTYNFLGGFTFNFYGTTYSSCFVSANGFISFGASDTSFQQLTVGYVRTSVRRIMSFYEDLEPQPGPLGTPASYNPRIFAQMYTENGLRKVRVVHEHLAEFANTTGPHGGEIVMAENGDINVFVSSYQVAPSINTVVGITGGGALDNGAGAVGQTAFGRNLSADVLNGPTPLGINRIGFELFDHSPPGPPQNPIDLIGFGFNVGNPPDSGIHFIRDPSVTAAGQAQYIVQ